ncbi:divalent-cation tolerance protein CutA [Pelagibacterium xiamenense]|uniref:divalent-cation tolerance protein CutA n=1 Tax=Pelagibacterium xiamenense TaxID=2901140 RepID=UPI001E4DCC0A|nr:divalent-cation tolerance protein CutA [Pelagibacterium xiamenense]MCD7060574.1 divalent-cation tolerance protein CutA [Pelagibacterium xiamenense]
MSVQAGNEDDHAVVVLITTQTDMEADGLARHLVEFRLAACVQRLPITSTYRWEGEVVEGGEVLLLVKTMASRFAALEEAVRALHSYEVPEIVCLPVRAGHKPYLDWMMSETAVRES